MIRIISQSERHPDKKSPIDIYNDVDVSLDWASKAAEQRSNSSAYLLAIQKEISIRDKELIKNRKEENDMSIKIVESSQRQMPRSKVGKFTVLDDVQNALALLSGKQVNGISVQDAQRLKDGGVIQIDLDNETVLALKKDGTEDPARSIVNTLKRKFNNDGLPFKVYASSDSSLTIMRIEKMQTKKK